jgi:outer membrane protein OmpA-like peptidoglycan-associated protein/tetratricopeptide (TPR) repeat protein
MIRYVFFLLIGSLVFTNFSIAQEEDEDCKIEDKKVLKILAKVKSEKLAGPKNLMERYTLMADATKILPDNAALRYEMARMVMSHADQMYNNSPNPNKAYAKYNKAAELFKQVIEQCPSYRPDAYYSIGYIYFIQDKKAEAAKWFEAFVDYDNKFPNEDRSKFPPNYKKLKADVNEILPEMKSKETLMADKKPFNPEIVQNVSTKMSEYLPMISPDNELIFYTRKVDKNSDAAVRSNIMEQFTVSQRANVKSLFDGGKALPTPFNNGNFDNYGGVSLSVDNKEMIICACKQTSAGKDGGMFVTEKNQGARSGNQGFLNCDLYSTTFMRTGKGGNDYVWTELKNLGPNINGKDSWEAQPTLSADGNTLYFTKLGRNTFGEDIYYSERNKDGTWGAAKPMTEINTEGRDKAAFLHQDSQTMYFASDTDPSCAGCRLGMGGLDIFYTRKGKDGKWSTPKNIGFPINGEGDEIGLFVSTDGHYAYFSKTDQFGKHDIYRFELYAEARPQKVALVKGELKDDNGKPVENATIEIAYSKNDEVQEVKVNGNDGKYAAIVNIDDDSDVMVTVKKKGNAFDSKMIMKEDIIKQDVTKKIDLSVKKLEVGKAFTINDILYATASYELTDHSKFILKGFVRFLEENPTIKVTIQGHTDDVGNDKTNLKLSKNRAEGVKAFLISQGISKDRLNSEGFGESKPKVKNDSDVNRAQNRRTDFVIDAM